MISVILQILENGLRVMRSNSKMLLVGTLVFVFPLLFVWVSQVFYTTAYNNIHTSEKLRVGIVHDTLTALFLQYPYDKQLLTRAMQTVASENKDIQKIRIYQETNNGMLVVAATDEALIGSYDASAESIRQLPFSSVIDFQQTEFLLNDERLWQAYKRIPVESVYYYIFSEHNLSQIDDTMAYRRQQSYFGLTVIFVFLMALAYWVHRQTHWQKRYYLLTATLQERDLFSNMIAHEFRSPLTAIKGYASFLEESKTLQNDEQRFAANIRKSAEHLVALVSDFLEVARLQSGKLKVEKQSIDVRTIVTTTLESLRTMASEKGLQLEFDEAPKPVMFKTDPARLQQILTNLVSNAIKYTPSGSVRLRCTEDYKSVIIRVMDTGMGISAEDQKKLFAPFTRVGGADASQITGTGLGMYITKQLIALLGGTIGVESIKDVGSHIVVTLTEAD